MARRSRLEKEHAAKIDLLQAFFIASRGASVLILVACLQAAMADPELPLDVPNNEARGRLQQALDEQETERHRQRLELEEQKAAGKLYYQAEVSLRTVPVGIWLPSLHIH